MYLYRISGEFKIHEQDGYNLCVLQRKLLNVASKNCMYLKS